MSELLTDEDLAGFVNLLGSADIDTPEAADEVRGAVLAHIEALTEQRDRARDWAVQLEQELNAAGNRAYTAWTIIANASGGNWSREGQEWQDAAVRWRDEWHLTLKSVPDEDDDADTGGHAHANQQAIEGEA